MAPRERLAPAADVDDQDDENPSFVEHRIPTELDELEKRLRIDKYKMDDELEEHPDLFHRVSREFMLSKSRRDQLKLRKEQLEASLDSIVRMGWAEADGKMTESGVRSRVLLMPAMKRAALEHLTASTEADLWQALKDAFDQRGYAIKDLVQLYHDGYWAPAGKVRQQQGDQRRNDPAYDQVRRSP